MDNSFAPSFRKIGQAALFGIGIVLVPGVLALVNGWGLAAFWDNVHWTLATWGMTGLGVLGWRSSTGRKRVVQGIFVIGLVSYALGQILWDIEWGLQMAGFPAVSDVFYLGMAPFLIWGMVRCVYLHLPREEAVSLYLDAAMVFTALASAIAVLYIPRAAGMDLLSQIVLVTYPVAFLGMAGLSLLSGLAMRATLVTASPYPLAGGLLLSGIGWMVWNSRALDGTLQAGSWLGIGFSFAHLVLGFGVAVWDLVPSVEPKFIRRSQLVLRFLPVVAIPLAVSALIWGRVQVPPLNLIVGVSGLVVVVLAAFRQSWLLWERDRLLLRGQKTLAQLAAELDARQRVEAELQTQRDFALLVMNSLGQGLGVTDRHRRFEYVNPAYARMVGVAPEDMLGRNPLEFVWAGDIPVVEQEYQHRLQNQISSYEVHLQHQDGHLVPALITGTPRWFEGGFQGTIAAITDLTLQKRTEEALRRAETQYRDLLERIPMVIYSAELGPEGRWFYVSPYIEKLMGFSPEEWLADPLLWFKQVHPDDRAYVVQTEAQIETAGGTLAYEYRMFTRSGQVKWVHDEGMITRNDEKTHFVSMGLLSDVTERKRIEEIQHEAEERFLKAFQFSPYAKTIIRMSDDKIIAASEAWEHTFGYRPEEVVGSTTLELGLWTMGHEREAVQKAVQETGKLVDYEFHYRTKAEKKRIGLLSVERLTIAGEACAISMVIDITARKRIDLERQMLLEIMRGAVELPTLPDFLALVHRAIGQVIYARNFFVTLENKATGMFEIVYSEDEFDDDTEPQFLGKSASAYVFHTGQPLLLSQEEFLRMVAEGKVELVGTPSPSWLGVPLKTPETTIGVMVVQHYQETDCYTLEDVEFLVSIAGQIALMVERKKTEEALLQFRDVMDASNDAIFMIDPVTSYYTDFNRIALDLLGYTRAELQQLRVMDVAQHIPNMEVWHQSVALVAEKGGLIFETQYKRKDGSVFPVEVSARLRAQGGQTILVAIAREITERKQIEEKLRQRLEEQEAVLRISTALRTAASVDEMLPIILEETLSILGTDTGSVVLYDEEKGKLRPTAGQGWMATIDQTPMAPDEGIAGYVFTTGNIYHIREFRGDPRIRASSHTQIPLGWGGAVVPIHAAQTIVGVMFVAVQTPREFSEVEIRLLSILSEITGNAIHRTSLHEKTERSLRRLAALRAIDLAITSSFDLAVSLDILLDQALSHLNVDAAAILKFDPSMQTLDYFAGKGFHTILIKQTHLPLGGGYAGKAALERRLISLPDLDMDEFRVSQLVAAESLHAYHAIPLIIKGQVKGVLEVFHRTPFKPDAEWLDFLEALAGQAAIAMDNSQLFEGLQRSNIELIMAYDATIEGWSRALDLRDQETEGHTQRVTEMTLRLAKAMGFNEAEMVHIRRGALLHDIGKMGIPDNILLKPGPLTEEEWDTMRKHPDYAYQMLAPIQYLRRAIDIPYCHHEKWDGTGYPRGLKGYQIPLAARIFSVVDVWDALRSDRPYRLAWPDKKVREYIREHAGTFFDPQVVEEFLKII